MSVAVAGASHQDTHVRTTHLILAGNSCRKVAQACPVALASCSQVSDCRWGQLREDSLCSIGLYVCSQGVSCLLQVCPRRICSMPLMCPGCARPSFLATSSHCPLQPFAALVWTQINARALLAQANVQCRQQMKSEEAPHKHMQSEEDWPRGC